MAEERFVVSAKLRSDLVESVKQDGVPLSRVIEAGVAYYSKLTEEQKKEFLLENTPGLDQPNIVSKLVGNIAHVPLAVLGGALVSMIAIRAVMNAYSSSNEPVHPEASSGERPSAK